VRNPKTIRAFSLVEVVLALGVMSIAAIAMIGLLSVGLQGNRDSKEQLQAATIAESICSTMRAVPTAYYTGGSFPQPNFPIPYITNTSASNLASTPVYLSWDGMTTNQANARFGLYYQVNRVTPVTGYVPTTSPGNSSVYLCLFWPPQAANPSSSAVGHFEVTSTFALP